MSTVNYITGAKTGVMRVRTLAVIVPLLASLAIGLLTPTSSLAKGSDPVWSTADVQGHRQEAMASVVDSQGNVIVTGYRNQRNDPNDDLWTVKYRADGTVAWRVPFDRSGRADRGRAVAVDGSDHVIVTGYAANATNTDVYTVKYDKDDGHVIWQDIYNGPANGNDVATSVVVDRTNNAVYVAGYSQNSGGNDDYLLLKYANPSSGPANTPALPAIIYAGAAGGLDQTFSVAAGSSAVAITGKSTTATDTEVVTVVYNLSGSKLWERHYAAPGALGDVGRFVRFDSSGNIIIAAMVGNEVDYDIYLAKYAAADGAVVWEKTFNGAFDDAPEGLVVDSSGDVYITGSTWTLAGANDFYTARYSATNGALVWSDIFNSAFENSDLATTTGIVVDETAGGGVFVTGYTEASGNRDFQTVKYNRANGHLLWSKSFNGPANRNDLTIGIGLAPAVNPDLHGNVFVSGYSDQTAQLDGGQTAATGGSPNAIQNSGKSWATDQWKDYYVKITSGTNKDAERQIASNSGTTLNVSPDFGDPVLAGDTYYIFDKNDYDIQVIRYDHGELDPPTGLTAETISKQGSTYTARITWQDNSNNEDGFIIERKFGAYGTWGEIARVGANVTTYDNSGLIENNNYYYRIKSYRGSVESYPCPEAHALSILVAFNSPAWNYIYNSNHNLEDYAESIAVGPDDNPVITGKSDSGLVGMFDYYTVKLDRADNPPDRVIWADRYDSMQNEMDIGVCLTVDNSNEVVVAGYSQQYYAPVGLNINSLFTVKYPASGPPATWEKQYNGPGGIDDRATAIASATDGTITVVAGYGKNSSNNDDIYLVKYLTDGTQAWAATPFDGGRNDYPSSIALDPSGNILVSGYSQLTAEGTPEDLTNYQVFIAKYNGATGVRIWTKLYRVTGTTNNRALGVSVDSDGDAYLAGFLVNASGKEDYLTIKYRGTNGDWIWEKTYDGPVQGNDRAVAIKVDPILGSLPLDGDIVVMGTRQTAADDSDIHLIRYSKAGTVNWERTLQRDHIDDTAVALAMDSAGYIYVAGDTGTPPNINVLGAVYDHQGTLLGGMLYAGAAGDMDESTSITVNHQGEAFVAGYATNASGNADYLVAKLKNPYLLVPTPFTVTPQPSYDRLVLNWRENTPGTSFRIERTPAPATSTSVWSPLAVRPSGTTTYTDTPLQAGTGYCYRIAAESGTLESRWIVTCATTTLQVPTGLAASAITTTSLTLTWNNVAGNTGYKVERKIGAGTWTVIGTTPANVTTYPDSGLTAGTTYTYRVSTRNIAGDYSGPTGELAVPTLPAAAVQGSPTNVASTTVTINWTDVAGETAYEVWRKEGAGGTYGQRTPNPAANAVSFNDTGLTPNTQYYYQVYAVNGSGKSAVSNEQPVLSKFVSPTLSTATGFSTAAIDLAWTDVSGETGYTVEYSSCSYSNSYPLYCQSQLNYDPYWSGWTSIQTGANVTSLRPAGLTPGVAYRFRVTANVTGNTSLPSNAKASWTMLPAPVITIVPASETSLTITWPDISGETNYTLERKLPADTVWVPSPPCTALGLNAVSCTDTGLALQTAYDFRLKAYNTIVDANVWAPPPAYSTTVTATTPLPAPSLNTLSVISSSQIDLSWSNVTGNTGYEVERCYLQYPDNPEYAASGNYWIGCTVLTPALSQNQQNFSSTGLTTGYTYRYRVRDLYSGGYSGWSTVQYATTTPAAPVMNTPVILSDTSVRPNWGNNVGETSYSLEWKQGAAGSWNVVTVGENVASYDQGSMSKTLDYYYRVKAVTAYGSSPYSSVVSVLPAPSLNPLSGITISKIDLSWSGVTGNNGYRIERKTGDAGAWGQIGTTGVNLATYSDTTCSPGTLYYYRVSALNATANSTGFTSAELSATTTPSATIISAKAFSASRIDISWPVRYGATNYMVQRKTGTGGTWSGDIANLPVTYGESYCGLPAPTIGCQALSPVSTSYQNTALDGNTTYCYRVYAWNATGGNSVASNEFCVATGSLPSVNLTASTSNPFTVSLNWTPAACNGAACETPDGFEVERKLPSGLFQPIGAATGSVVTSFVDRTGIQPRTTYRYLVRPYRGLYADFATGVDSVTLGQQAGTRASGSDTVDSSTPPINVSDSTGVKQITVGGGVVEFHTTTVGGGAAATYNYTHLNLKNPGMLRDDFDIQVDFSLPAGQRTTTQFHVYARLQIWFPDTAGGLNNFFIERSVGSGGNMYQTYVNADGGTKVNNVVLTNDLSGKLRLTREAGKVSTYYWSGASWTPLGEYSGFTVQPATTAYVRQYAQKNEAVDLRARIDNLIFRTGLSGYSNEAAATTPSFTQGANTCQ